MASREFYQRDDADAYLTSLSGDAAERVTAMKWARYLGAAFGTSGALEALRYYREIHWISRPVQRQMVDYVRGLPIEELERTEVDTDLTNTLSTLEGTYFERHAKSLEFIAAISGKSIEHGLASLHISGGITGMNGLGDAAGLGASMGTVPDFQTVEAVAEAESDLDQTAVERAMSVEAGLHPAPDRPSEEDDGVPVDRADETPSRSPSPDFGVGDDPDDDASADDEAATTGDASTGDASTADAPTGDASTTDALMGATPIDADSSGDPEPDATAPTAEIDLSRDDDPNDAAGDGDDGVPVVEDADDLDRCIALTRAGERCSRSSIENSDYCRQHSPDE